MKRDLTLLSGLALREAAARQEGQPATPMICQRIKREFLEIMRNKHHIYWSRYARQIKVEFLTGSKPNLIIPPHLLQRAIH